MNKNKYLDYDGLAQLIALIKQGDDKLQNQLTIISGSSEGSIKSQIDTAINGIKGDVKENGNTLGKLEGRIEKIEGEGEGSVKNALAVAKGYTDSEIQKLDVDEMSVSKNVNDIITIMGGIKEVGGKIAKGVAGDVTLAKVAATGNAEDVAYGETTVKAALDIINGNASTNGSILNAVANVVNGAPEAFDTLKEIADWIDGGGSEASSIVDRISANKEAIETLNGSVDTDGSVAKSIFDAINSLPEKTQTQTDKGITVGVTTEKGSVKSVSVAADLKAADVEYKANTADMGVASNAVSVSQAISALETKVGETSVADQISNAIDNLDTTSNVVMVESREGTDGESVGELSHETIVFTFTNAIKEENGIISAVTGSSTLTSMSVFEVNKLWEDLHNEPQE